MIEVEQKFELTQEQEKKLLQGAMFLKEISNEDSYFDTADYSLSKQDHWLRSRNGKFELKQRIRQLGQEGRASVYDEIEDEDRIRKILELSAEGTMIELLKNKGIEPFAHIVKHRRSYERDGFHIDLDICDFGYALAEIELLVQEPSETLEAQKRIEQFAQKLGLDQAPKRGKVVEYLFRFRPDHYQALLDAGVISL